MHTKLKAGNMHKLVLLRAAARACKDDRSWLLNFGGKIHHKIFIHHRVEFLDNPLIPLALELEEALMLLDDDPHVENRFVGLFDFVEDLLVLVVGIFLLLALQALNLILKFVALMFQFLQIFLTLFGLLFPILLPGISRLDQLGLVQPMNILL